MNINHTIIYNISEQFNPNELYLGVFNMATNYRSLKPTDNQMTLLLYDLIPPPEQYSHEKFRVWQEQGIHPEVFAIQKTVGQHRQRIHQLQRGQDNIIKEIAELEERKELTADQKELKNQQLHENFQELTMTIQYELANLQVYLEQQHQKLLKELANADHTYAEQLDQLYKESLAMVSEKLNKQGAEGKQLLASIKSQLDKVKIKG